MRKHSIVTASTLVFLLASATVALAATVTVTPTSTDGWTTVHESCNAVPTTGSQSFVNGPATPPAGTGSYEFRIGANPQSYETFRQRDFNGTRLSSLTSLDYWTYVSQSGTGSSGQAVYIDIYIDNNGDGVRDDILTFEPIYQTSQGSVVTNVWQHWDALNGFWWSDSAGGPPPFFTIASYVASHPDARIQVDSPGGFLLSSGCGNSWAGFIGNVDKLTIGVSGSNTTYDFEPGTTPPPTGTPTSKEQCKNGGWMQFTNPSFRNQGECVSFVNHHDGKGQDDSHAKGGG
jgi:hypothetical protein